MKNERAWFPLLALAFLAYLLLVGTAFATDKPATQEQSQSQMTNTNQANTQTVNAGGGQGGGASNQLSIGGDRSTAVGLAHGSPTSPACPNGLVPGSGKHRGHGSPLYSISAVCDAPNEAQRSAIQEAREHELALARAQAEIAKAEAERDRAAAERIRVETSCITCQVAK